MMRKFAVVASLILASGFVVVSAAQSSAETATSSKATVQGMTADEFSAQSQRILRRRVPVYRRALGPNAVRVCNAHYEQEYRPSGTVIVPRMNCYWRG